MWTWSADKSKQMNTFLEIWISNKSIFNHVLTYLSLSINGFLEIWLGLLTLYFRNPKNSQQISLGSNLAYYDLAHDYPTYVANMATFTAICCSEVA